MHDLESVALVPYPLPRFESRSGDLASFVCLSKPDCHLSTRTGEAWFPGISYPLCSGDIAPESEKYPNLLNR